MCLSRGGLFVCPGCYNAKLIDRPVESGGYKLVCPSCKFEFGPVDPGSIKPFIQDLYENMEYDKTEKSFAEFGLASREEED